MSVKEQPVIEFLAFEVFDAATGAWRDLAAKATECTITRGGARDNGVNKISVGTLEATLYGAIDLSQETALRPNSPIRVAQPGERILPGYVSEPSGTSSPVFTSFLPASMAGFGVATYLNDADLGTSPAIGVPNAGTRDVPAGSANRFAQRVLGDEAGMTPGRTYSITVPMGRAASDSAPAGGSFRVVAYTYDPTTATVGAQLGASAPRGYTTGITPFAPFVITAPASGLQVLLAVEVAATTTITTTQANRQVFGMRFGSISVGRYFPNTPRFTGTLSDLAQTVDFDKATGIKRTYTSLYGVDSVQPLANTQRYGAVTDSGAGFEAWNERIQRLATSATVFVDAPPSSFRTAYTWPATVAYPFIGSGVNAGDFTTAFGLVTGNDGTKGVQLAVTRRAGVTSGVSFSPSIRNTSKPLKEAGRYRVEFDLYGLIDGYVPGAFAVEYGRYRSGNITVPKNGTSTHVTFEFENTAVAAGPSLISVTPTVLTAPTSGFVQYVVRVSNYTITAIGDPKGYNLADVAYESDLASHFDLACNSVGAKWWVDRDNVVQFSRALIDPEPVLTFSDTRDGSLEYTDVALAFDTRNVVNSLTLNQHGRNAVDGNAADSALTVASPTLVDKWGLRGGDIDTCLYAGPGYESVPAARALEVIGDVGRPAYAVTGLTWNVQQDPTKVPLIDVYTPIAVRYEQIRETARIIGIKETITPSRWVIDLDLTDIKSGVTFADLGTAWQGLSFTQLKARLGAKTFRQLNTAPTA